MSLLRLVKRALATQPWAVLAAAVRGKSHEKTGQPCQDAVAWRQTRQGLLLGAVADGAGSARLSEVGSELAARHALDHLETALADPAAWQDAAQARARLRAAFETARAALAAEAQKRQARPADLATTLLVCVAGADRLWAAQVGDGAVVFAGADGAWQALTRPAAGEYLNETVFLTSDAALERLQIETRAGPVRELALFSDGLQMLALKMPEAAPHAPFFQPLFAWFRQVPDPETARAELEAWLRSPRVTDRAEDDLTLLLARRRD
jgi:hypothetical protein